MSSATTEMSPTNIAKDMLLERFRSVPGTAYERAFYETLFDADMRRRLVQEDQLTDEGIEYVLTSSNHSLEPLKVIELDLTPSEVHQALKAQHTRRLQQFGDVAREQDFYKQECKRWGLEPEGIGKTQQ